MSDGFAAAAWSWVEHLRHGGSTPWLDWVAAPAPAAPVQDAPGPGPLPGAAELELVRRLAARPGGPPAGFTALADRVLARSGPGRGLAQLPLLWPDDQPGPGARTGVGAPPTDPARVPVAELVRVGVGTLADLLLREPTTPAPARARHRRPFSKQFELAGAPVTTAAVRAALAAAGHVEGGRRPEVLVFAPPFDAHLFEVWSARAQHGTAVRWPAFVGRWARRDELPPSLRLDEIARHWAERVGPERVHVVAAPGDAVVARRTAASALGLRVGAGPAAVALRDLSPAGADLLRRLGRVLALRLPAAEHRRVLARAADLLGDASGPALAVPAAHRAWAEDRAGRLVEGLRAGGYAVHGDLEQVAPRHLDGPDRPRRRDVLDLVLDACLALAADGGTAQEAR